MQAQKISFEGNITESVEATGAQSPMFGILSVESNRFASSRNNASTTQSDEGSVKDDSVELLSSSENKSAQSAQRSSH